MTVALVDALTTVERMDLVHAPVKGSSFSSDPDLEQQAFASINAASRWFTNLVGWDVRKSTDEKFLLSGRGSKVLWVPKPYIVSVSSLVVSGCSWTVIEPGDVESHQRAMVATDRSYLVARYGIFPKGYGNVQATMTVGYDPIPEDVQDCVAAMAWLAYEESNRLGVTAMSLGPEHVNMVARNSKDYDRYTDVIAFYARKIIR